MDVPNKRKSFIDSWVLENKSSFSFPLPHFTAGQWEDTGLLEKEKIFEEEKHTHKCVLKISYLN